MADPVNQLLDKYEEGQISRRGFLTAVSALLIAGPGKTTAQTTEPVPKTQYYTSTSLDGFIATEDDSLDWLFSLGDVGASSYPAFIAEVGALAMGSATYEWILRNAENNLSSADSPWPYAQPTWVFSRRSLPLAEGANIRIVQGDVRPIHAEMRAVAGSKNIWIVGGGDIAGQFYDAGLLNEVIVQVGSVTLGRGKQLFPRRVIDPPFRLVTTRQIGSSFAELSYEVSTVAGAGAA